MRKLPPAMIGNESQVRSVAPPCDLDSPRETIGCFQRNLEDCRNSENEPLTCRFNPDQSRCHVVTLDKVGP